MVDPVALDRQWLSVNPLPAHDDGVDKNGRGRVLLIGGCRKVPGGILLTAEAAFRTGAGKVTIATITSAAISLGIACPACAVTALPETADGEISPDCIAMLAAELTGYDAVVFGPAMVDETAAATSLAALLQVLPNSLFLLLDAFALRAAAGHADAIAERGSHTVLTPNSDELAAMLGVEPGTVASDPIDAGATAAQRFGSTVIAKGATSHLFDRDTCHAYSGGGVGLAMSGSGDVPAGLIAGLGARGLTPLQAAAWGVWLHGEAGRHLARIQGPIGYLVQELAPLVPELMHSSNQAAPMSWAGCGEA